MRYRCNKVEQEVLEIVREKRMVKICDYLCRLVERREAATEELISDFISEMALLIRKKPAKQDFSYYELVDRCRRYDVSALTEKEKYAYMMGSITGVAELYYKYGMEVEMQRFEEVVLSPSSRQFAVLEVVSKHPGITRKDLLEAVLDGQTASSLSHITGSLQKRNYLLCQKMGREKRFFATPRGDEMVRSMRKGNSSAITEEAATIPEGTETFQQEQVVSLFVNDINNQMDEQRIYVKVPAGLESNFNLDSQLQKYSEDWQGSAEEGALCTM